MLLYELKVPQELGAHSLHLDQGLGRGFPGGIQVALLVLLVLSVALRLGHLASDQWMPAQKKILKLIYHTQL